MSDFVGIVRDDESLISRIQEHGRVITQTINVTNSGEPSVAWQVITQDRTMEINTAYRVNALVPITLTLPTNASNGAELWLYAQSAPGWVIQQQNNHQIQIGALKTTQGLYGRVVSTNQGDWLKLIYFDGLWIEIGLRGNLEVN